MKGWHLFLVLLLLDVGLTVTYLPGWMAPRIQAAPLPVQAVDVPVQPKPKAEPTYTEVTCEVWQVDPNVPHGFTRSICATRPMDASELPR